MGKDVNCVLLPLNCLLVVLITVVIDAEIKLVATGAEGSELKSGTVDERLSQQTYEDSIALKIQTLHVHQHQVGQGVPVTGSNVEIAINETKCVNSK